MKYTVGPGIGFWGCGDVTSHVALGRNGMGTHCSSMLIASQRSNTKFSAISVIEFEN